MGNFICHPKVEEEFPPEPIPESAEESEEEIVSFDLGILPDRLIKKIAAELTYDEYVRLEECSKLTKRALSTGKFSFYYQFNSIHINKKTIKLTRQYPYNNEDWKRVPWHVATATPVQISADDVIIESSLTSGRIRAAAKLFKKNNTNCSYLQIYKQIRFNPEDLDLLITSLNVQVLQSTVFFLREFFINNIAINKLQSLKLDTCGCIDEDLLKLAPITIFMTNDFITDRGLNNFLKQWKQGTREISWFKMAFGSTHGVRNYDTILDGLEANPIWSPTLHNDSIIADVDKLVIWNLFHLAETLMDWLTVFDPDPIRYKVCLHTITVISTPIVFLGLYCVFWRSPKSTNKIFKILLASSVIFSYVTQFAITAGTAPVLVFPMTGGYPLGFFPYLGIPTTVQLVVTAQLVIGSGLFTVALFFNRQHALAPLPLFANYLIILKFITIGIVIPTVIHVILLVNMDHHRDKQHFVKKYPKLCRQIPDYWEDRVLMIDPSRNQTLVYMNVFYLIIAGCSLTWITFFVSRIRFYLNTNIMSATTKAMHRTFVKSLVIQSAVHYLLILSPCVAFCSAFLFEWEVPGLSSVIFCGLALSDPCAIVSLIVSHKEYRKYTLQLICNSKGKLSKITSRHQEVSSIFVVSSKQRKKTHTAT